MNPKNTPIALAVLLSVPVLQAGITDQLVTHLTFDSNLLDISGKSHHGTAVGNIQYGPGQVGTGAVQLSFKKDGTSFNYVTLGAPADLNFGTSTDFSLSFWTKFQQFIFDPPFIGNKDWLSGQYQGWMVATGTDGRLQWNYGGSPGQRKDYDGPGSTMNDGRWHHVVVTFLRAGEVMTYLDGALVDERDVSASLNTVDTVVGQAVNLGQDGTGRYTDGNSVEISDLMMDDLGIWRRVLTAEESKAIYEAGLAGKALETVVSTPTAPVLVRQPSAATVVAGESLTLRVLPRGTSPFTFQWRRGSVNLPLATNAVLNLSNVQASDAGQYTCVVGNSVASVATDSAEITVDAQQAPTIAEQPLNVAVGPNGRAQFQVRAAGVNPIAYQWFRNGSLIAGATQPTLVLARVQSGDAGRYTVQIRAANGQTISSQEATLTIVDDIRQGLVTHLTFDTDFSDASGRNNHGTPVGLPTLVEGRVGKGALRFSQKADGSEFNYVTLGTAADLEFSVDADFSFSMWVKFSNWQRDPVFIANKNWNSGGNVGYALATGADGRFQWNYAEQVGERRDYDSGPGLVGDGSWHHVAVTFQRGGQAVTFVDGKEINRQPLPTTGTTVSPGLPTNIGQDGRGNYTDNSTVSMVDGTIDDVAIWRRSITSDEILGIYRKGQFGANVQEKALSESLVAWLPLDYDTSDRSGRGNHGVRAGNPRFVEGRSGGAIAVTSITNGSSFNYVSLGAPADLQFGKDISFSVSLWTSFTNWTGDPAFIGNKDWRSGGNQGWAVATAGNGRLQWNLGDGDAGGRSRRDYDGPGGTLNNGAWHHIATVFDRLQGVAITYLDGAAVSTNSISGDLDSIDTAAGLAVNIGQDGLGAYTDNGAVGLRDGRIDDVAVWRRSLGAAEVQTIFQRGQQGLNLFGMAARTNSLPNGVASGDVTSDSVVLWTRSLAPGVLRFGVSTNSSLDPLVFSSAVTNLQPEVPVKVSVTGLNPGVRYFYRVLDGLENSAFGTFKTAPAPQASVGLRFGVSGDSRGELAPYPSIGNVASRRLDFFVNLGDTIYADVPSPAVTNSQVRTLEQFRRKHAEVLGNQRGVPSMADLRASTVLFTTIDDHEVINDFAGGAAVSSDSRFDTTGKLINETQLYRDGLKAFSEFNPLKDVTYQTPGVARTDGKPKLYRAARYGLDASLFLLDARSFRDAELTAPEDPNNALQVGAFLSQSMDLNPLTGQALPRRTMLGQAQLSDLKSDLLAAEKAGVIWKFIGVPEPIQNLGVLAASDRFEGYAAERSDILGFIHTNRIRNVVFIAADIHGTLINNLTYQPGSPAAPQIPVRSWEITTGAIAYDAPFGPTVLDLAAGVPSGSGTLLSQFLASLKLPNRTAFDALLTPVQKDQAITGLVNSQIQPLGYTPLGLEDSGLDFRVETGGSVATFTYGWTEFEIDSATRALRVTTYGLPSYAANQINDQLLLAQPAVVNRFTVSAEKPALQLRRLATGFRVVWPKSEEGYRLERTVNLGASANWTPVESTVVGDENSAAVTDEAAAFYRLRKP